LSKLVVAGSRSKANPTGSGVEARAGAGRMGTGRPPASLLGECTGPLCQGGVAQPRVDRLALHSKEAVVLTDDQDVLEPEALTDDDVDELLVEEISIDGMCGVY
jgi:mycofactocin precursor